MTNRIVLTAVAVAAAVAMVLVATRLRRGRVEPPPPLPLPAATPAGTARTPTATPSPPPHRLAGVAVAPEGFAVVENPDGTSQLYRVGQTVPGLGRLTAVGPAWATFATESGRATTLYVRPAAPPTPTPVPEMEIRGLIREFATPAAPRARRSPRAGAASTGTGPGVSSPQATPPGRTVPPPPA